MAYTSLPAMRNSVPSYYLPTMAVSENSKKKQEAAFSIFGNNNNNNNNKVSFCKTQRISNLQNLTISTNVVTNNPATAPPPERSPETTVSGGPHHHPAWTSILQDRWEGELQVQGQIPLWLVCI